jgi:hypothetical protein
MHTITLHSQKVVGGKIASFIYVLLLSHKINHRRASSKGGLL